ncbi:MAG: tRNA preQ1(34) S-adenosylmethionine ribosyltransferase-isomerase QueA [Dissulfurispiraceae bacterium]
MKNETTDFDFELPDKLIALRPAAVRDRSKLLILRRDGPAEHRVFVDISDYLDRGDLLILNNTKVMPVRLMGSKPSGGRVDLILVREDANGAWEVLCKGPYRGPISLRGDVDAELFEIPGVEGETRRFRFCSTGDKHIAEILEQCGSMPLPPYIKRTPDEDDMQRYQTVYAEKIGSIAAPTAGLHFTDELLGSLIEKGVLIRRLTLHVGPGTFKPIKTAHLSDHVMQPEYFEIEASLLNEIDRTKRAGKRVITVGTTATRAIEGFLSGRCETRGNGDGIIKGSTDIFIHPGYEFRAVDGLLTNFHLPRSTPLMLASAFCGFVKLMEAYHEAIANGYRFFSYGDAMLIL